MIGMGIFPIMRNENTWPKLPDHAGHQPACVQVGNERAIGQAEIAAPVHLQDGVCRHRLTRADFRAAMRRRLTVGQIQHADMRPLGFQGQDGAAAADFRIVGMAGDDEIV